MKEIKMIVWIGSSLDQLKKFPNAVKDEIGFALHRAQEGKKLTMQSHSKGLMAFLKSSVLIEQMPTALFMRLS